MEKVKALYLNAREGKLPEVVELNAEGSNLDLFYKLLDCNTIDIVKRRFGDELYYVVCDDEALIRDRKAVLSYVALDSVGNVFDNIIICKPSESCDRDFDSLTEYDLLDLSSCFNVFIVIDGCRLYFTEWSDVIDSED